MTGGFLQRVKEVSPHQATDEVSFTYSGHFNKPAKAPLRLITSMYLYGGGVSLLYSKREGGASARFPFPL